MKRHLHIGYLGLLFLILSCESPTEQDELTYEDLYCSQGFVELWGSYYDIETTTFIMYSNLTHVDNLIGIIPPQIGCLESLTTLIIDGSQLTGEIPPEIGNLTNLTNLSIFDNPQLTGEIPLEIGNLTNLTSLSLNDNQLTGEIPSEIGNLINLVSLGLFGNDLTGEIPSEIGNLTNLSSLWLDNNQLTGEIPEEICNQGDTTPFLYNNQLCPPYPECIEDYVGEQDTSGCPED